MRQVDVGIMPLDDGPWERGKCGLKLINYMAAELPTIASPVGVNCQIVEHGATGYLAGSTEDWIRAFRQLQRNRTLRVEMGRAGRTRVEQRYCLGVTAPSTANWLRAAAQSN